MTQKLVDGVLIDLTPEEEADLAAKQAANAIRRRPQIQEEIDLIERSTLQNRGSRELNMRLIEREAAALSASIGTPAEAILAAQPYYVRLAEINTRIAALRVEWLGAPE